MIVEVLGGPWDGRVLEVADNVTCLDVPKVRVIDRSKPQVESTPVFEVVSCPLFRRVADGKVVAVWPKDAS